jgi:hypothetical protein
VNNACTIVSGADTDRCTTSPDSCPGHTACDTVNKICVNVPGGGTNQCTRDPDCCTGPGCKVSHTECQQTSCVIVDGAGTNQCSQDSECQQPSFSLSAVPSHGYANRGGSTAYTVSATAQNGFSGSITLGTAGLPTGITGSFSRNPITPSQTSVLTLTVSDSAAFGTRTFNVTGTSGSLSASVSPSPKITVSSVVHHNICQPISATTGVCTLIDSPGGDECSPVGGTCILKTYTQCTNNYCVRYYGECSGGGCGCTGEGTWCGPTHLACVSNNVSGVCQRIHSVRSGEPDQCSPEGSGCGGGAIFYITPAEGAAQVGQTATFHAYYDPDGIGPQSPGEVTNESGWTADSCSDSSECDAPAPAPDDELATITCGTPRKQVQVAVGRCSNVCPHCYASGITYASSTCGQLPGATYSYCGPCDCSGPDCGGSLCTNGPCEAPESVVKVDQGQFRCDHACAGTTIHASYGGASATASLICSGTGTQYGHVCEGEYPDGTCKLQAGISGNDCGIDADCNVPPLPVVCTAFKANPSRTVIPPLMSTELSWSCSNTNNIKNCTITPNVGDVTYYPGTTIIRTKVTVSPPNTTTYTLLCTDKIGRTVRPDPPVTVHVYTMRGGELREVLSQ